MHPGLYVNLRKKKNMNYRFKTKPYKHQMTALEKSWNKENFAYFMEMGTGKTKVLIDNLAMLYDFMASKYYKNTTRKFKFFIRK